MRALDNLLTNALARKPRKLLFETSYSHTNLQDWLINILPDWHIIIPETGKRISSVFESESESESESELESKAKAIDITADDLIDGACEPLAYWLSEYIKYYQLLDKNVLVRRNNLWRILQQLSFRTKPCQKPNSRGSRIFERFRM